MHVHRDISCLTRRDSMRIKTTSIHNLNADRRLNTLQRVLYHLFNRVNNLFPYNNIDNSLILSDFICEDLKKHWARLDIGSSPARRLSDLFLLKLPWYKIRKELGEIKILDVGCGSGNYGKKLMEYSDNNIASYTGIDIYKDNNWTKLEEKYSNFRFRKFNGINVSNNIPRETNFFITQSAIEHFDEDLSYFEQIRDYILSYQRSVIQVHLFPSSSCFRLYRYHGVRQYTPRTVSKITRLFKKFSYSTLYRLGGKDCIRLHYEFITKPYLMKDIGDLREVKPKKYEERLFKAIKHDMKYPQNDPNYYALVIHSNWMEKIF